MKPVVLKLTLFAALAATLGGCSDAIFAAIDTAQKTATNTLSQTMSVFDIAVPVPGTYYVAAGGIFQGVLGGTTVNWTPNTSTSSRPWNPTGLICNAMTLLGANLYGGFVASDGTASLYQSSPTPFSFASGAKQLTTQTPGEQVTGLSTDGTNVFVSGAVFSSASNSYVFQLEYATPANAVAGAWGTPALSGQSYPVLPVAYASGGTPTWWTASGTTLYSTTALPAFTGVSSVVTGSGSVSLGTINGVFANGTAVIVATKSNGVFYSLTGGGAGSWVQVQPDHQGSVTVSYLCAAGPIDKSGSSSTYLVGSDGYGYYSLNVSTGSLSRYGDSTTALYSASVSRIVLDNTTATPLNVVLMGTNAKGLWRTVYDAVGGNVPASGQSWINE